MIKKSLKQLGKILKKVKKPVDKLTGAAYKKELIGYFKMFETILSGMDKEITKQQEEIDNLKKEVNKKNQNTKEKINEFITLTVWISLFLSIVNISIFILFFYFK